MRAPTSEGYKRTRDILREQKLVTVCEEAGCPNVGECWSQGHATMMIMGEICTRGCTFCNVATGKPSTLDAFEPGRVAHAVAQLGLAHVVITSVDRDDLTDGGADHFAQTIRAVRHRSPATTIEILTPDFLKCPPSALEAVVEARPDVFNHNLETVPSLYLKIRPGARYFHSLRLLQRVKELDPSMFTKSGIMVGLGFVIYRSLADVITYVETTEAVMVRARRNLYFIHKPQLQKALARVPDDHTVLIDLSATGYVDLDNIDIINSFIKGAPFRNLRVVVKGDPMGRTAPLIAAPLTRARAT